MKRKVRPQPSYFLLFVVILSLCIVTLAFAFVLTRRLDDANARDMVRQEQRSLDDAQVKIQTSLILEQSIYDDKNKSRQLETLFNITKIAIENNTMFINQIDTQTNLINNMTTLVMQIQAGYDQQITNLENALAQVLSISMSNATTLKSGMCTLQGVTGATVSYDYKKLTIEGLDYFYYIFGQTPFDITIDNLGFAITACDNGGLYQGPLGSYSPLYAIQRDKFGGTGMSEITHVRAGNGQLQFKTTSFSGPRTLSINDPLSHFVEFF